MSAYLVHSTALRNYFILDRKCISYLVGVLAFLGMVWTQSRSIITISGEEHWCGLTNTCMHVSMEQELSGNDKSRTALFMLLSFPLGRGPRVHCPMVEMIYLLSAPIESSPWFLMCSVDSKAGLSCSVLVLVSNAHHHPHFNSNNMVSDSHDTMAPMSLLEKYYLKHSSDSKLFQFL